MVYSPPSRHLGDLTGITNIQSTPLVATLQPMMLSFHEDLQNLLDEKV